MKSLFPFLQPRYFITCLLVVLLACEKTEMEPVEPVEPVKPPVAAFSVKIVDPAEPVRTDTLIKSTTTYIDSVFHFFNLDSINKNLHYHWDFGDGGISTEKNPTHSYSTRGTYNVTVIVSNEDKAADTSRQTLTVLLGRRSVSLGDGIDLSAVGIVETASNGFLLLAGNYDHLYLYQLDSTLKTKSVKTFPTTYRLITICASNDGNYMLTGSTHASDKYDELIKMASDGTILWSKVLVANDIYDHVAFAPDGGYIVIGSRLDVDARYTVIIKTDSNGNVLWQKDLRTEGIRFSLNAVVDADGIVLPGIKQGYWSGIDSVVITKWNHSGSLVWKTAIPDETGNPTWWETHITKLTNGNYAVVNKNRFSIFYFSSTGGFIERRNTTSRLFSILNAADGNMLALQFRDINGNGQRYYFAKLTTEGTQKWEVSAIGGQNIGGNYGTSGNHYPSTIIPLQRGGTLVAGTVQARNKAGTGTYSLIVLMEAEENGKIR